MTNSALSICNPKAQFVKLSFGPKIPCAELAPGLGAPPGPFPPPLMSVGAVGNGPVGVLEVVLFPPVVPFPLLVEVLPVGVAGGRVMVLTMVEVKDTKDLLGPRLTPVVMKVESVTCGVAVLLPVGAGVPDGEFGIELWFWF